MTEEIKRHAKTLTPTLSRWERELDVVLLAPSSITTFFTGDMHVLRLDSRSTHITVA
jgi:hypothetical protein